MTCQAVRDRFTLLDEDELSSDEALAVRAHLAECAECAATRRAVRGIVRELRELPPPRASRGLRDRIAVALDMSAGPPLRVGARRWSPWERAAPFIAAAAVVALAFALGSYLSSSKVTRVAQAAHAAVEEPATPPAPSAQALPSASAPATGSPSLSEQQAVAQAIAQLENLQRQQELARRDKELLKPQVPGGLPVPPALAGSGKPAGTFAGGQTPARPSPPTTPTTIDVDFLRPENPVVGQTANGTVAISAREDIPEVLVSATGDEGLTIDKPGGVLYRGPVHAGEQVRVPLPMTATTPGSHEIDISVRSNAPGGNTQFKVFVPGFAAQAAPAPPAQPGEQTVSLVFQNTPIRQALLDIARQGKLRVDIPTGQGTERISRDVRGVPARAALRAVAEAGGYRVTEKDGVFHVSR